MAKTDEYGQILTQAKKAHDLHLWIEHFNHEAESSEGDNRWALIRYAGAALAFFFGQEVKAIVEQQEGEARFLGAQTALDFVGDSPAGASAMKAAVASFLETRPEFENVSVSRLLDEDEKPAEGDVSAAEVLDLWRRAEPERGLPPEQVLSRYEAGRTRPDSNNPCMGWDAGDRISAHQWCETIVGGGDAPKPLAIATRYLEDMDLTTSDGRLELVDMVLSVVTQDVHEEGHDLHPDNWGDELWDEVLTWARTAHRIDRGEELDVVDMPPIFAPDEGDGTTEALASFFDSGGVVVGGMEGLLADDAVPNSYSLAMLLLALIECRAIEPYEDGLRATSREIPTNAFVQAVAVNLGSRRPPFEGLEAFEQLEAPGDEHADDVDAAAGVNAGSDVNASTSEAEAPDDGTED